MRLPGGVFGCDDNGDDDEGDEDDEDGDYDDDDDEDDADDDEWRRRWGYPMRMTIRCRDNDEWVRGHDLK